MNHRLHKAFFILGAFLFLSCQNLFKEQNAAETLGLQPVSENASDTSACVRVDFKNSYLRTALPTVRLTDFVLTGTCNGESQELARAETKSDWGEKTLVLASGQWAFTMTAQVDAANSSVLSDVVEYRAELSQEISAAAPNTLTFDMKPVGSDGSVITRGSLFISITLDSSATTAKYARAKLYEVQVAATGSVEETELASLSQDYDIGAGETVTYAPEVTASGADGTSTYRVEVTFYNSDGAVEIQQNTWAAYARVVQGLTTTATETGYNLNEVYKIEYKNTEGAELAAPGEVQRLQYSRFSEAISLPDMKKEGWYFGGWYESASYSGNPVTEIPAKSTGKKTLYARWFTNTIYVGGDGKAGNDGLTAETAVASLDQAESLILKAAAVVKQRTDQILPYTVYVSGTVNGSQALSENLTASVAESITLRGAGGLDANGLPQDVLNANAAGSVLVIKTAVPVTLKDIQLTGGKSTNGGGINNSGTLSLSDGCLVSGNTASNYGGGVYSTGTMFMYGSAVIGDSTKNESATESGYSNKAGCGGGIYSTGNLYLGYSESNTKTELTGGVFYNFSANTGGIYQYGPGEESSSNLKLDSGFVSYNAERGIYAGKCTFTMTGGTINGNKAFDDTSNAEIRGAGFYAGTTCTALISGGTISSNMAAGNGGGIYIAQDNSYVTISGGTISGNTADGNGNGIALMNGSFKMQGGAKVDSGNDVYLASEKVITVTGELTGTTPVATITPAAWSRGTSIVQADGTNLTSLKEDGEYDYTNYFALSDADWERKLSSDKKTILLDAPIYVAGSENHPFCGFAGDDTNGTGTKSKPFATLEKACSVLTDSNADYTIYIDGEVTGTQTIPGNLNAKSVTLSGATGNTSDILNGNSQGTTLTVATTVPVTIKNLKITGGSATYGGGIYVAVENAFLTLAQGCLITENKAPSQNGGGVYITGGRLVLQDDAKVSENEAYSEGGGIAVYSTDSYAASLEMSGTSSIENCKTTRSGGWWGGGILASGKESRRCSITLSESASIKGCSSKEGGGIGMIDFVDLELTDTVEISGNTASSDGAGIRVWNSTASISGGIIKSNTAPYGGAVSVKNNSTFYLSGGAQVDSGNDVALASGTTVTVSGELTGTAPVATLNPADWTRGSVIVTAASGVTFDETLLSYFALSDADWETKLSSDKKTILLDAPIYVAGAASHPVCGVAGDDTNGTGTKSKPFATLEKACSVLTDSTASYTIYVDGTLSGVQTLPDTVTADTAASLTVQGTDASAKIDAGQEGPSLSVSAKNIPVTLLNLTITKGKTSYRGGGIHILNADTTLTLGDGTAANAVLITGNTGLQGGGIYNAGSLTIKAGTTITSNTAEEQGDTPEGGGIYNAGTLTMEGGSITSNTAAQGNDGDGGGILNSGTFTFAGGEISGNEAANRGGGIYNDGATIFMSGSAIIGDKSATSAATAASSNANRAGGSGGGIYSARSSSLYIGYKDTATPDDDFSGGVYGNYAAGDGGGICAKGDTVVAMAGGTIAWNGAAGDGSGVLFDSQSFSMEGAAAIPLTSDGKNDVYLATGKKITVTGSLSAATPVATLTLQTYTAGTTLLAAEDGVTLADEVEKFALTPDASDPTVPWRINTEGKLVAPVPVSTLAEGTIPTAAEYLELSVSSGSELVTLAQWVSSSTLEGITITLTEDIEFTEAFATSIGTGWEGSSGFSGTFDGGGHTISGFNTAGQTTTYPSLFGCVNSKGTIKNVILEGTSNCGGIAGCSYGTIENCESRVTITGATNNAAGIVCSLRGGIVKNCKNTGNISSNTAYVGGIVGYMSNIATVDSCINTGTISGTSIVGGIIGSNWRIVRNCINTGNVVATATSSTTSSAVGGIAGYNYAGSPGFGVENCFNMGTVQGKKLVGGLTGACDTSTTTSYHSYIANSYNAGSVTATDASGDIGGVSGGIITTSGTGTWTYIHNYYRAGTANLGVFDKTDSESGSTVVEATISASTIAGYMNDWLSSNNSEGNYKLWTTKIVNGETLPVPDVGYDW